MDMKRNSRWFLAALTAVASLVGFFLRRKQLVDELLPDGSLAPGSSQHIALGILTAIVVVALILFLLPLEKKRSYRELFSPAAVPNFLQILCALGLIAGNVVLWSGGSVATGSASTISRALTAMLPPLGLLSALCIAAFALLRLAEKKPTPVLYMVASVYLVVRLFVRFQMWNIDPSIHDYCYQLLAAICTMLGLFQLAGFCFDRGKRRIGLFWTLLATYFSSISLADALHSGALDESLIIGALLLSMAVSSAQLLFAVRNPEEA